MVDSGDLAEANKEKKGMEKAGGDRAAGRAEVRAGRAHEGRQGSRSGGAGGRGALAGPAQGGRWPRPASKQKGTKSDLEKKRDEVANEINGIYTDRAGQREEAARRSRNAIDEAVRRRQRRRREGFRGQRQSRTRCLQGRSLLGLVRLGAARPRTGCSAWTSCRGSRRSSTAIASGVRRSDQQAGRGHQRRQQARDPGVQGRAGRRRGRRSRNTSTGSSRS